MEEEYSQDIADILKELDIEMYDEDGWLRDLSDILAEVEELKEDKDV